MQSRRRSMQEVVTGTSLGFLGSLAITYSILYGYEKLAVHWFWLAVHMKAAVAWTTVILCTIWSLVRGYSVRRWFAKRDGLHYEVQIDARADRDEALAAIQHAARIDHDHPT